MDSNQRLIEPTRAALTFKIAGKVGHRYFRPEYRARKSLIAYCQRKKKIRLLPTTINLTNNQRIIFQKQIEPQWTSKTFNSLLREIVYLKKQRSK